MKRGMIAAEHKVALLIDASKFHEPTFCEVGSMADIHIVVTEAGALANECQALRDAAVELRFAEAA
jgi:DeoR/GlpR family transcriptional regulator of sugar metabolism